MGDFLSKELSKKNPWWIPRYRYLELRYFCLQYPDWRRKYELLCYDSGLASKSPDKQYVNSSKIADRTAEIAIQRKILSDSMKLVEQAAIEAEPELYHYIMKAVTEKYGFIDLKREYCIPCEKDMFYDRRRKFFWLLSKSR